MSLLSGSELFEKGTAGDDDAGGVLRADSALGVRPSSATVNGDATTGAFRADSTSRVQPSSSPAASDGMGGALRVPLVDEAKLSDEGLRSRLKVLGRAESTLAAMKSRALAELSRRHNKRDAQRLVRDELQTSKRDAQRDVEIATRLAELPATSGALDSGDIPVGHAQLIARAAGESPIDERLLVEAANNEPFDEFMQTVKLHQRDVAADDGQSLLDRQRKKRKARIFESSDSGMFVLTGEFDQITGARIATALTAKERQLWHREDPNNRATPQQRMADALAELISEPTGDGRSVGTDLLVIADFDVLEQQLENPRLVDGSPIPITELHELALEANLLPSIFDTKTQDMWLGRRVRTATEAQRIALIARDQCCIGCGANPLWCQAHHIIWWSKNGPTNLENLVLVCNDCHHKIHDEGWQVHKHPKTGKYYLKPPTHPTDKRPTVPVDKSARNSSGESPTRVSDDLPANSVDKALSGPSGECPTVSPDKPANNMPGQSPAHPSDDLPSNSVDERSLTSSDKPTNNLPNQSPAHLSGNSPSSSVDERSLASSDKPARSLSGECPKVSSLDSLHGSSSDCPTVSSDEPPTRPSGERAVFSSDESSRNSSGERSAVSSGEVSTISSGPPDRVRTRADPARPDGSDATRSTIQNAPEFTHTEQAQREKQTSSHTEQQHPTSRTTGHDPVDAIDTS
ncbi:MAG: DUF222 domain-containing protein [Acidimicrobiia bacterium]|nr:DUF222 domain-containing protein [Acidimicrobiia bacterium]